MFSRYRKRTYEIINVMLVLQLEIRYNKSYFCPYSLYMSEYTFTFFVSIANIKKALSTKHFCNRKKSSYF